VGAGFILVVISDAISQIADSEHAPFELLSSIACALVFGPRFGERAADLLMEAVKQFGDVASDTPPNENLRLIGQAANRYFYSNNDELLKGLGSVLHMMIGRAQSRHGA